MKPLFGVLFHPEVELPLHVFGALQMERMGVTQYGMNCKEVRVTDFGFLELVPAPDGEKQFPNLYVPPGYIQYMLRGEDNKPLGFLSP